MMLDVLGDDPEELPGRFAAIFSEVKYAYVDSERPVEGQVLTLEERLGEPSIQRMLVYSEKYRVLGTVLSRRYVNAAEIAVDGPLRLADVVLVPQHVSRLPRARAHSRVLFLSPHCDEPYIGAALLHRLIGDEVFLYSFTHRRAESGRIRRAYRLLGLGRDDYRLGSLQDSELFRGRDAIMEVTRELLEDFEPTVVISSSSKDANFDHVTVAHAAREVVLHDSRADLLCGYAIQSRKRTPQIFPLFPARVYRTILRAFGEDGLGPLFKKYLPFLEHYLQTHSEPIFRMIGDKRLMNVHSLPLEAERISSYRIPNLSKLQE